MVRQMKKLVLLLTVLLLLFAVASCSSLRYYSHSISGGLEVLWNRQDIDELLVRPDLDSELRRKLELAREIRAYSVDSLHLPDNDSYLSYTDLKREHVVWNVFAAPEFSLELKRWCFLFAGCVGYKGWFSPDKARAEAGELRAEGYDVYTGGVDAYSTLGWFDDPLLNTFIDRSDAQLAALIFHELAHQTLYIQGDTAFNESFASAVEMAGVETWLLSRDNEQQLTSYLQGVNRRMQFRALVSRSREALATLYQQDIGNIDKRQQKQQIIADMRSEYMSMKSTWNNYSGYDRWFEEEINNAKLGSVALYHNLVPAFLAMLNEQNGDFAEFYRRARELASLDKASRDKELARLQATYEE